MNLILICGGTLKEVFVQVGKF